MKEKLADASGGKEEKRRSRSEREYRIFLLFFFCLPAPSPFSLSLLLFLPISISLFLSPLLARVILIFRNSSRDGRTSARRGARRIGEGRSSARTTHGRDDGRLRANERTSGRACVAEEVYIYLFVMTNEATLFVKRVRVTRRGQTGQAGRGTRSRSLSSLFANSLERRSYYYARDIVRGYRVSSVRFDREIYIYIYNKRVRGRGVGREKRRPRKPRERRENRTFLGCLF